VGASFREGADPLGIVDDAGACFVVHSVYGPQGGAGDFRFSGRRGGRSSRHRSWDLRNGKEHTPTDAGSAVGDHLPRDGAAMTPAATKKGARLYQYYASMDLIRNRPTTAR
jgi:hypothetical protein